MNSRLVGCTWCLECGLGITRALGRSGLCRGCAGEDDGPCGTIDNEIHVLVSNQLMNILTFTVLGPLSEGFTNFLIGFGLVNELDIAGATA